MNAAIEPLREKLSSVFDRVDVPRGVTFVSALSGKIHSSIDVNYWLEHLVQPVRFTDVMEVLTQQKIDLAIEVGPRPQLTGMLRRFASSNEVDALNTVASLDAKRPDYANWISSVGAAWCVGAKVDWKMVYQAYPFSRVALPLYPFQRQRYWYDPPTIGSNQGGQITHPLLGTRQDLASGEVVFNAVYRDTDPSYLADHVVSGSVTVPGAAWIETLRAAADLAMGGAFPLLLKYLDCNRVLSVQVHPNDTQGAELTPPDLGKTEAWVIMAAEPNSSLYAGLRDGVDKATFEAALRDGTAKECLHEIQPQVGDCIFIPAGTVHALGEGLVVAEIQQSSNTTFRLFDWNRVGADGKSRPLHIQEGVAVTDFQRGPVAPQIPQATTSENVEQLVHCDKFVLDRVTVNEQSSLGGDDSCHIIAVLEGTITLEGVTACAGETLLVPASCGAVSVTAQDAATLLDMYLP